MNTHTQADESLIEGLARVVGVQGDQVWLATEAPAACGSCATQSACGSGKAKRGASWCVPRALGPGQNLALGDQVLVGVDRAALTRASLSAYALPLVTMLVAASALQTAGDAVAAVAALAGLLAGAAAARVLARRWREALVPVVLGRASNASGSSCPSSSAEPLRRVAIPVVEQRSL